jgi:hypothetical protein
MNKVVLMISTSLALSLAACSKQPANESSVTPSASEPVAATTTSTDPEFEKLKTITPVNACATLTPEKLSAVFPDLKFEVHQKLDPQMSGYTWDSRCTYWAGVGTIEFAKDVPTHTVDIFINTVVSDEKAQSNLASRVDTAKSATGYQAQTTVGTNAYTITQTGVVSLYFVKGQTEIQLNFSDLKTPNDEKIKKLIAIAQSL